MDMRLWLMFRWWSVTPGVSSSWCFAASSIGGNGGGTAMSGWRFAHSRNWWRGRRRSLLKEYATIESETGLTIGGAGSQKKILAGNSVGTGGISFALYPQSLHVIVVRRDGVRRGVSFGWCVAGLGIVDMICGTKEAGQGRMG